MRTLLVSEETLRAKLMTVASTRLTLDQHEELLEKGKIFLKNKNLLVTLEKVKQAFPYTQDQWEVLDHLEEHGHTFMRTLIKNCWKLGHSAQIDLNCASMSGIRILFTRADARFR